MTRRRKRNGNLRWYDRVSSLQYRLLCNRYRTIVLSLAQHHNISPSFIVPSHHHCIVTSLYYRTIASSSSKYGRKCRLSDDAIVNCKALSGFHTHLLFKKLSNLFLWRKAFSNCLVHENFPVHRKKTPSSWRILNVNCKSQPLLSSVQPHTSLDILWYFFLVCLDLKQNCEFIQKQNSVDFLSIFYITFCNFYIIISTNHD